MPVQLHIGRNLSHFLGVTHHSVLQRGNHDGNETSQSTLNRDIMTTSTPFSYTTDTVNNNVMTWQTARSCDHGIHLIAMDDLSSYLSGACIL